MPELIEDAVLNQVTLILKTVAEERKSAEKTDVQLLQRIEDI